MRPPPVRFFCVPQRVNRQLCEAADMPSGKIAPGSADPKNGRGTGGHTFTRKQEMPLAFNLMLWYIVSSF